MANPLEMMLYDNKECFDKDTINKSSRYDKGMFISYNNHRQGTDTLYQSLKHQYKSIVYALTGINISKSSIRLGKVPRRQKVMDISHSQMVMEKSLACLRWLHTTSLV